jgi:hypothetical protein
VRAGSRVTLVLFAAALAGTAWAAREWYDYYLQAGTTTSPTSAGRTASRT